MKSHEKTEALKWAAMLVAAVFAVTLKAEDVVADEVETAVPAAKADSDVGWASRLSFNAFADVETAYICRGAIYDTRPYSAQYAAVAADLAPFGVIEPSVWTYSAMSSSGQSSSLSHYAYAEVDYLLRYYYDIDIAARDAVKATPGPEFRRDLTFGGVGVAVDF